MKYTFYSRLITLGLYTVLLLSCSKNDPARRNPSTDPVEPTLLTQLQHSWTFESVKLYRDSALSGDSLAAIFGNPNDFMHFSPNDKLYTVLTGSIDSANYNLYRDSTLLINQYYSGVAATIPDTVSIRVITDRQLILARRNKAGDWGKFTLKR